MIVFSLENPADQEFIDKLSRDFERLMFSTARNYTSSKADQEDIVQEALERLIKKLSVIHFFPCYILTGYIVSTVRNTAINYLKKQSKQQSRCSSLECEAEQEVPSLPLDELLILAEQQEELKQKWKDLSEQDQIVLEGKYILGYTDEELATRLKCKVSSIRMRLSRARRRAFKLLADEKEGAVV